MSKRRSIYGMPLSKGSQLVMLVKERRVEEVITYLDAGVDPDYITEGGATPLLAAAGYYEYYDERRRPVKKKDHVVDTLIRLLLNAGASVDFAPGEWPVKGFTALIFASAMYPYNIGALIENGADVNQGTAEGFTPLMAGAGNRYAALALLKAGADASAITSHGEGVLHFVKTAETARILKGAGADVHQADRLGFTPLLRAARDYIPNSKTSLKARLGLVNWLASQKGTLKARTRNGMSAFDAAKMSGNTEVYQCLRSLEAEAR